MKEKVEYDEDIELPRDRPFYLMQHQGQCQLVRGMFYTVVELTWATEKDHKTEWVETGNYDRIFVELEMNSWGHATAYGRRDFIPDGHYSQEKIQIIYCYYQPMVVMDVRKGPGSDWDPLGMNEVGTYVYWYDLDPPTLCLETQAPSTGSPLPAGVSRPPTQAPTPLV